MDITDYEKVLRSWHIEIPVQYGDFEMTKTVLNTESSLSITDAHGVQWILEQIAEESYSRKQSIAETLERLENHPGMSIRPYQRNSLGQFITCFSGKLCTLRPHTEGIPLNRNSWFTESWRSDALADFIICLHRAGKSISMQDSEKPSSIIDFIKRKTETLERHRPDTSNSLSHVFKGLETSLFPVLSALPTAFCHGDFHTENVVWGENSIQTVISWECCGFKPEIYDAALMVGSIGFESPDALASDFTRRFIHRLKEAALFKQESWLIFYDLVIATRYEWLAKWMHTQDERARDLEILYMNLLHSQKTYILKKWTRT